MRLPLVLPLPHSSLDRVLRPGSACALSPVFDDAEASIETDGMTPVWYADGGGASNIVTFADRAGLAGFAAALRSPTSALMAVPRHELVSLGHYDVAEGRVRLDTPGAHGLLAEWLNTPLPQLDAQLLNTGGRYETARMWKTVLSRPSHVGMHGEARRQQQLLADWAAEMELRARAAAARSRGHAAPEHRPAAQARGAVR